MAQKKVKVHHLHDNVYRTALDFMVSNNPQDATDYLRKDLGYTGELSSTPDASNGVFYYIPESQNTKGIHCSFIWLRHKRLAYLAHELTHFVFNTFDLKGIPTRIENDEAFAYYMEYWINTIQEVWNE